MSALTVQSRSTSFEGFRPEALTSESDEIESPADLKPGYIICVNGRDYYFTDLNAQAIFVQTYNDPDLVGPPRRVYHEGIFWFSVESLHVY